jgi:hypothetical protein
MGGVGRSARTFSVVGNANNLRGASLASAKRLEPDAQVSYVPDLEEKLAKL